jgi:hypothetical protein
MKLISLALAVFLTGCQCTRNTHGPKTAKLNGVYQLDSLQGQDETVFKPMPDVDILKIFTESNWVSVAYLKTNHKAVYSQGGVYTFAGGRMRETIQYHSKDTNSVGVVTTYQLKLSGRMLHQSGVFKAGTPDAWKVEEKWVRTE